MIIYNNKYRGPLEYDKFILNVFQYLNEINYLIEDINVNENPKKDINDNENSKKDINDLKSFKEKYVIINQLYDECLKRTENINLFLLNFKEA